MCLVVVQEFIRQQVAEKERIKMEEKLRREREDAIEEAKLAAERERMKMDFEREKEKGRRKEVNYSVLANALHSHPHTHTHTLCTARGAAKTSSTSAKDTRS